MLEIGGTEEQFILGPVEVDRLRQVNWLPATLAALLAVLALLAVGHAVVTGVGRRRRVAIGMTGSEPRLS